MKPSVLKEILVKAFQSRHPVLITGAPGIGKSDITAQAAEEAKADLILSHPVVSDPTDYKGFPFAVDSEHAEFLPFGDLRSLMTAKKSTVFFLDDLGQARPAVQASLMQLVLGGRVNGHYINKEKVSFVAATNRPEDLAGVQSILEPVKSRFILVDLQVDVDDFCRWALDKGNSIPPEVVAFIRFRPELLHSFTPSREIKNSPCPRAVAKCGSIMTAGYPEETWFEMFGGCCGEGFSTEFIAFLKIFRSLPDPKYAIAHPNKVDIPDDPATLYAFTGAVAAQATDRNFNGIVILANRLPDEFNVRLVTDALLRDKSLTKTQPFRDWFVDHQDVII